MWPFSKLDSSQRQEKPEHSGTDNNNHEDERRIQKLTCIEERQPKEFRSRQEHRETAERQSEREKEGGGGERKISISHQSI